MRFISTGMTFFLLLFPLIGNNVFAETYKQKVTFTVYAAPNELNPATIRNVAIIDGTSGGELKNASGNAIAVITSKLMQGGFFTLVEREQVEKVIREQAFALSGFVDVKSAVEVGKILGVDTIFLVTVGGSSLQSSDGYDTYLDENKESQQRPYKLKSSFFSINLKVIDVQTAQILFAKEESSTRKYKAYDLAIMTIGDILKKLTVSKDVKLVDVMPDDGTISNEAMEYAVNDLCKASLPHPVKRERMIEVNFEAARPGVNYAISGQWDKAINLWENVYVQAPQDPAIYASLGVAYEASGCAGKAVEKYQKALEIKNNNTYSKWLQETQGVIENKKNGTCSGENKQALNLNPMVIAIEKDKITIDLGAENEVTAGQIFQIVEKKYTLHPVTGKIIGEENIVKAEIQAVEVLPQMSKCKITRKFGNIAVGNIILK